MGIFDALTGAPAKRAAQQNMGLYGGLKQEGLGYLDSGFAGAQNQYGSIQPGGLGYLDAGRRDVTGALDEQRDAWRPLGDLGQKYGGATTLALDALGANGSGEQQRAGQKFQAGPGYQFALDQAREGTMRAHSASGLLGSGNLFDAVGKQSVGYANQEYNGWLDRLLGFTSPELAATSGAAAGFANNSGNRANFYAQDAASRVGLNNLSAQSLGGLYGQDAQNRVGLASGTTAGLAGVNDAKATAQMQASGNVFNLGLGLASLGTGAYSGFGGGAGGFAQNANIISSAAQGKSPWGWVP